MHTSQTPYGELFSTYLEPFFLPHLLIVFCVHLFLCVRTSFHLSEPILICQNLFLFVKTYFHSCASIFVFFFLNLFLFMVIFRLWNIAGTILVNWTFMLQLQWSAPLNFPVMWQWSLILSSSFLMSSSQIQQVLLNWIFFLLLQSCWSFCWNVFSLPFNNIHTLQELLQ